MAHINLDRRFAEWTETSKVDPDWHLWAGLERGTTDWKALAERRRVVVLAEAGAGKSSEFKNQAAARKAAGEWSFFATVQDLAQNGSENAFRAAKAQNLGAWRASDKHAWFYVDSVDEAKARGSTLEKALAAIAEAIDGAEGRAHVFLSGRPSDWEFRRDLESFEVTLPIPEADSRVEKVDVDQVVVDAMDGPREKKASSENAIVVLMLALDRSRVESFARLAGVADMAPFFDALDRSNLRGFARRPLDLQWLVGHWRVRGSFGSLKEMLELSLSERSKETSNRARIDALSADRISAALDRIGAALVFGRLDSIAVPDQAIDLSAAPEALAVGEVLEDWSSVDRANLITRPVFVPAQAGFVKPHNDNEGAVRGFLAARWLDRMLANNCPVGKIEELLFGQAYGIDVAKPSMKETAAWLCALRPEMAKTTVRLDPWLLLEHGDPGSLPLEARAAALDAIVKAGLDDRRARWGRQDAMRRFAKADLAPFVRKHWTSSNCNDAIRALLLEIIWLGEIAACADLAAEASFGAHPDHASELLSGRALAVVGSDANKERYARHLVTNSASMLTGAFWDGVQNLFPLFFSADDLAAVIGNDALLSRSSDHELSSIGKALAPRIVSAADAEALTAALVKVIERSRSVPVEEGTDDHPLLDMVDAFAERLLDLSPPRATPTSAIDAYLCGARIERHRHTRRSDSQSRLSKALSKTPERRRAAFWRAVDAAPTFPYMGVEERKVVPAC
jgi:hypothetical protein